MTIKQDIPQGFVAASCSQRRTLRYTSIPWQNIITDWRRGKGHFEPVWTTIIPVEYVPRDLALMNYYRRLGLAY
jgi:hypothetical protein